MLRNYFKTAWRAISSHRIYTIINLLGLTLGIASCLIIFLVVRYELGYDGFHKKADRTYRITLHALDYNPSVSLAIVPRLRNDFPELEQASQVLYKNAGMIKIGANRYNEKGYLFADEEFPMIFDYQWLAGDSRSALKEPNSIVLTQSIARKYFGDQNPMGQIINLENQYNLKVTGLIADPPGNTNLPFIFIISLETIKKEFGDALNEFYWIQNGGFAYIVIPKNYSIKQFQSRIHGFINKYWGADIAKEATLIPQPLKDIHFDQRYLNNTISPTTSRETYWALAIVAIFIIAIACINFINLATAQAIRRAKEVGVRKTLGADRSQLIWQFLGETILIVLFALVMGLVVTAAFLPQAEKWLNIKISVKELSDPTVVGILVALVPTLILLAGLYPAFVQSAFKPAISLKASNDISVKGLTLRKSLVIVQFAISQILIVGTLVVASQMNFFENQDLGYNKEAVVSFGIPNQEKRELLRQQLESNPGVKEISFSSGAPANSSNFCPFRAPELGVPKDDVTELKFIDEHYTDMFALTMLAGKKISKEIKDYKDTVYNVVVNEALIQKLGIKSPQEAIGKHIIVNGNWNSTITGVVKNFQSESKHKKIRPIVMLYRPDVFYMASMRIQPNAIHETIARMEKSYTLLFPDQLFDYEFLDAHIANWYKQEQRTYTAFKLFSIVAIIIGCLGLYGLIAFATAQRTKEVGIRKVLGASLMNIVSLFAKEFILLIAIAFIVAAPIAYFVMHNWLQNFAYQITIGAEIFLVAIATSFMIAGMTIAYQAVKAGVANPVKSLRTE